MSLWRTLIWKSGRLISTPVTDGLALTLTTRDPQVPNLPLESPTPSGNTAEGVDTIALSDSAVSTTARVATASDTIALSDSAVATQGSVSVSAVAVDTLVLGDSAVSTTQRLAAAADTIALSDSAVSTTTRPATATDALSLSDSAVSTTTRPATGVDSLSLSDSAVAVSTTLISATATDSLSLIDAAYAVVVPPTTGSGSAGTRRLLQQIYEADFARYEAERRAAEAPQALTEIVRELPRPSSPRKPTPTVPAVSYETPVRAPTLPQRLPLKYTPPIADLLRQVKPVSLDIRATKPRPGDVELAEDELQMLAMLL